jgi:DNA-binding transcriptional ArsR family regulator
VRRSEAAPVFAALGDETRLRIVGRLAYGDPLSIARLAEGEEITRQAITKHLRVLEAAQLVHGSRQGREQLWTLNARQFAEARRALDLIGADWDDKLVRLKEAVERREDA